LKLASRPAKILSNCINNTMNSLVFTTIPSPRSQATSDTFRQYGITGEVATPISGCAIVPASRPTGFFLTLLPQIICQAVQAGLLALSSLPFNGMVFRSVLMAPSPLKEILTIPEICVSFGRDNMKESIQSLMVGLSFRKESSGQRHYYRGHPTPDGIISIVEAGGAMDTFAPYGATNIHGYSALRNIQKILLTVCGVWATPYETTCGLLDFESWTMPKPEVSTKVLATASVLYKGYC